MTGRRRDFKRLSPASGSSAQGAGSIGGFIKQGSLCHAKWIVHIAGVLQTKYIREAKMNFNYSGVSRAVGTIGRMGYGQAIVFARPDWQRFVPRPDPMRQMMLASSGHRPETEREPEDWFRFWINGTSDDDFMVTKKEPFNVRMDAMTGDIIVSLPVERCPKCRGEGYYRKWPERSASLYVGPATVPMTETVEIETVQCDHAKDKDDPTRVSWP